MCSAKYLITPDFAGLRAALNAALDATRPRGTDRVRECFRLLSSRHGRDFVRTYSTLETVIRTKLVEFYLVDRVETARTYFKAFFGEDMQIDDVKRLKPSAYHGKTGALTRTSVEGDAVFTQAIAAFHSDMALTAKSKRTLKVSPGECVNS